MRPVKRKSNPLSCAPLPRLLELFINLSILVGGSPSPLFSSFLYRRRAGGHPNHAPSLARPALCAAAAIAEKFQPIPSIEPLINHSKKSLFIHPRPPPNPHYHKNNQNFCARKNYKCVAVSCLASPPFARAKSIIATPKGGIQSNI